MSGMIVGGLFNAFAFAGAGFLFSKFNHSGYIKEMHRHNLAEEKMRKEQEEFFEDQTRKKNKLRQLEMEIANADKDMRSTDKAFELYDKEYNRKKEETEKLRREIREGKPPGLDYKPSREMQHYENLVKGLTGAGIGLGVAWYLL